MEKRIGGDMAGNSVWYACLNERALYRIDTVLLDITEAHVSGLILQKRMLSPPPHAVLRHAIEQRTEASLPVEALSHVPTIPAPKSDWCLYTRSPKVKTE